MKKRSLLKLLASVLAVVTAFNMVACGKTDSIQNDDEAAKTDTVVNESNVGNSEELPADSVDNEGNAGDSEELTYPLKTDHVLSIFDLSARLNTNFSDEADVPVNRGLEVATGVQTEWQYQLPTTTDFMQTFNLMLTDETLPDIIIYNMISTQADQLIEDGVIRDLTDLIPEYAPDYWEYINSDPARLAAVTSTGGKLYGFHGFMESDVQLTYMGPVIRQDWLEECGLEVPVTLEDWEEVLVAFNEKYDATFAFRNSNFNGLGSGTGAYGNLNAKYYIDDNGELQFAQAQPEWKEYMEYLARWYDMGLVDKDTFTLDDATVAAKALNNEMGVSFTKLSQVVLWNDNAEEANTGAEWIGIPYPTTAVGEPVCSTQTSSMVNSNCAYITTSCPEEEVITALKWLNFGYTEEGMYIWNYGVEGESWERDAEGNAYWSKAVLDAEGDDMNALLAKYCACVAYPGPTVYLAEVFESKQTEVAMQTISNWITDSEAQKHYVPSLSLAADVSTEYADLYPAIQSYVSEMAMKYILGEASLDDYDDFLKGLSDRGLERCLEIQRDAYKKYMSK